MHNLETKAVISTCTPEAHFITLWVDLDLWPFDIRDNTRWYPAI